MKEKKKMRTRGERYETLGFERISRVGVSGGTGGKTAGTRAISEGGRGERPGLRVAMAKAERDNPRERDILHLLSPVLFFPFDAEANNRITHTRRCTKLFGRAANTRWEFRRRCSVVSSCA